MKKNARILFYVTLFTVVMVMLFGWGVPVFLQFYLNNMYFKGIALLLIFSIVVLSKRFTWNNYLVYLIAAFTLLSMLMDTSGNPIANKPLEWIVSPVGELQVEQEINNYAPGEFAVTVNLAILKPDGELLAISIVWLYLYRFVQYLVVYSMIGTLLGLVVARMPQRRLPLLQTSEELLTAEQEQLAAAELKRREEAGNLRRNPPEEIQASARQLKKDGNLIPAIKLVRRHSDMSLGEAKHYVEQL